MQTDRRARLYNDLLRALALSLDLDEGEKLHHAWRVGALSHRFAAAMDIPEPGMLFHAGLLHDIGGIGLRHHTVHLASAGHVTPEAVKHVFEGVHILQPFEPFRPLLPALMDHHERHDGTGYPHGKRGERIDTAAGILQLADTMEVTLRNGAGEGRRAAALEVAKSGRGTVCRPDIADAALEALGKDPDLVDILYDGDALADLVQETDYTPPDLERLSLVDMLSQLFWLFARIIDAKHAYTAGHTLRVAHYAVYIAKALRSDQLSRWDVLWAALLHDVGKLGVPRSLLQKPGRLSDQEWKAVRKHASDTVDIIASISDLEPLAYAAASNHERYDGTGYPRGTEGEDIPLIGRILAFADAYDAMTTDRAYRRSLPHAEAMRRLREGVGSQFDPHLARIALPAIERHGVAAAALPTNMEEFHEFFDTESFDRDGDSGEHSVAEELRPVGRGVLLLELEPWAVLTLSGDHRIIAGRRPLEQLISTVSSPSLLDFLDTDGQQYLRSVVPALSPDEVRTRYLFAPSGTPMETIISAREGGYTLLYRTAENRLQSIKRMALFYSNFLNSSEAVCFLDMQLRILDVNRTFLNLYGYKLKEVVGMSPMDLLVPDKQANQGPPYLPGEESHVASWSGEMLHRDSQGAPVDVNVTVTAIRDARGNSTGYIMHAADIRERKRSEARMSALNRCLLGLGADYGENVLRVIRTLGEVLGAQAVDYRRLDGEDLVAVSRWARAPDTDGPTGSITTLSKNLLAQNPDGVVLLSASDKRLGPAKNDSPHHPGEHLYLAHVTRPGATPLGVLVAVFDRARIMGGEERDFFGSLASALSTEESRRAAAEELQAANRELERLSQRKSELMAITSHDLKSPLAAMIGYSDLLREQLPAIPPDKGERYLGRISAAGNKLLHLIDDILDLERLETGALELNRIPADPGALLQDCIELCEAAGRERGVRFELRAVGPSSKVNLDVPRMEQVINNLLSNAIKFSPVGATIEVVLDGSREGHVQVHVCDRGPGIPPESLQAVFDRYYQAVHMRSRDGGSHGAGLGLAIVKHIVEGHGGQVWAENRRHGGARFVLDLPLSEPPRGPAALLLDPQGGQAGVLAPVLSERDVTWAVASDSNEARELLGAKDVEIVFVSAELLPDLEAELHRVSRRQQPPVLVLIQDDLVEPPRPFSRALSQPILPSEILELLDELRLSRATSGV